MAATFNLEIVTPERSFFSDEVEMVILKTPHGEMGIMKGHTPMVAAVAVGSIRIKKGDEWLEAVLTEGFMEVKQDKTIILTDTAEWPNEIDVNRARAAKERAEERMHRQLSRSEHLSSQAALARALVRLRVTKENKF